MWDNANSNCIILSTYLHNAGGSVFACRKLDSGLLSARTITGFSMMPHSMCANESNA